jgi:hypothetical protein
MMKKCNPFPEARHGLTDTDHMWNFFSEHLHPSNPKSGLLFSRGPVYGISTDLEEATDFGNPLLAEEFLKKFRRHLSYKMAKKTFIGGETGSLRSSNYNNDDEELKGS